MAEYEKNEGFDREEIFSKAVRAGKRTYFFDVKATKKDDYYLTITESKKRFDQEGRFHFEKHKIFLYKEDFEKFIEGLSEAVSFIKSENKYVDNKISGIDDIDDDVPELDEDDYDMKDKFSDDDYDEDL